MREAARTQDAVAGASTTARRGSGCRPRASRSRRASMKASSD